MGSMPESGVHMIGGRYAVEGELARGGMGVIYRVRDLRTGSHLALKRTHALEGAGDSPQTHALTYEYQLLASLRHPRIIRVHDQGRDDLGPYYTMELLDGSDVRRLAPMPWREACKAFRDVASSLALVHARGLVHRDVSPGNIRLTSDGRAKLLDFGTVTRAGRQTHIAGTPPCVAPEVLYGNEISEKVDVYALGVSAYFALTGVYPYAAHSFAQLPALWAGEKPEPPSRLQHGVPGDVDDLLLSLLALDPVARPSAAVVIDRLTSAAQLPDENDHEVVASYLLRPPLSGRGPQMRRAIATVPQSSSRPTAVIVEGGVGVGKSRFLEAFQDEAWLLGATVIAASGRLHQTPYSLCRAIVRQGLGSHGKQVRRMIDNSILALSEAPSTPTISSHAQGNKAHGTGAIRAGFVSAIASLVRPRSLLIALDDAATADPESLAVLATLMSTHEQAALTIVFAGESSIMEKSPAIRAVSRGAVHIGLEALCEEDIEQLVLATFGKFPSLPRLSAWLYAQTGGHPAHCMDTLRLMLDTGALRHRAGTWHVAPDLSTISLDQGRLARMRFEPLSSVCLELATLLSVVHGVVDADLAHALAKQSCAIPEEHEIERALADLVKAAVLIESGHLYAFAQPQLALALYSAMPSEKHQLAHRLVARFFAPHAGRDPLAQLHVGWHLTLAGDLDEAQAPLTRLYTRLYDAATLARAPCARKRCRRVWVHAPPQLDVDPPWGENRT